MGSMYTGFATPTEAAGVGALGALLLALPRLTRLNFWNAMVETARTSSLIFAIVAGVLIYVHFLGFTGMPGAVAKFIVGLDAPVLVVLICILALYLVLGMFLDGIGMLLLTVPIILPTIEHLGIHPIVFGVLVVRMVEIGLITPPVGLNVFIINSMARDVPMIETFRGVIPFVLSDVIRVAVLVAAPTIILILPKWLA
jgi:TRAP-type C4-dicarboxylate transport system permease large subunit